MYEQTFDMSQLSWYWYPVHGIREDSVPIYVIDVNTELSVVQNEGFSLTNLRVDNIIVPIWVIYNGGLTYTKWTPDVSVMDEAGIVQDDHLITAYTENTVNNLSVGGYFKDSTTTQQLDCEKFKFSNYGLYQRWNFLKAFVFKTTDNKFFTAYQSSGGTGYDLTGLESNITFPSDVKGSMVYTGALSAYGLNAFKDVNASNIKDVTNIVTIITGGLIPIDPSNPYNGGDQPDNPGDGEFDYAGGGIDIPDLPTISVCDSGFVTLYAPTSTQLNSLASFLWSDAFSLDTFKKLFNNPMDCILGLSIIPVNVPTGTAQEITVGNIVSTVSCNVVTQQFVTVDCGTLKISPTKFSGSYLDYSPYVKCYIYLPFIGIQQINIDDVMNSTVHVVYHVDLLTGAMCCYIEAQNRKTGGVSQDDTVLYTFMGQCAESVPLSSTSFSNTIGSILNAAASIGGVVATAATGGAAAPVAAGMLAGATTATANAATSLKPNIQHSGSMGGSSGMMAIKRPFMIFDAPHTAIPDKQYKYTGYPSNKIVKLSSLSGFNVIQSINLSVDGANQTELNEIKSYLESGVII